MKISSSHAMMFTASLLISSISVWTEMMSSMMSEEELAQMQQSE